MSPAEAEGNIEPASMEYEGVVVSSQPAQSRTRARLGLAIVGYVIGESVRRHLTRRLMGNLICFAVPALVLLSVGERYAPMQRVGSMVLALPDTLCTGVAHVLIGYLTFIGSLQANLPAAAGVFTDIGRGLADAASTGVAHVVIAILTVLTPRGAMVVSADDITPVPAVPAAVLPAPTATPALTLAPVEGTAGKVVPTVRATRATEEGLAPAGFEWGGTY